MDNTMTSEPLTPAPIRSTGLVGASGPRLPQAGEEWASKETGLTVKIMKADADAVWWENPAVWSFPSQTQTAAFLAAMNLSAPCPENREPLTDRDLSLSNLQTIAARCSNDKVSDAPDSAAPNRE